MDCCRSYIRLEKAARKWEDGLPLGNGRLGAMVMGKVKEETIVINEETLWYGAARNRRNKDGRENIDRIRELLLKGELEEASFLARLSMTSIPKYNNPYQPAGELRLYFMGHQGETKDYKRVLDMDHAIAAVTYTMNGIRYHREHFISTRYNVLAIRITAEGGDGITVSANIGRKPFEESTGILDEASVGNWGQNGVGGVRYLTGVRMAAEPANGNQVKTMGDFVYSTAAREVVIYLASQTSFPDMLREEDKEADQAGDRSLADMVTERLKAAERTGYERMKQEHLEDYHRLYDRFRLSVNEVREQDVPADVMLKSLREGDHRYVDYLTVLLVNYARYLMISSSYRCELPANLQGIWNGSFEPPWQSQFTININTEMNYWFVEKVGLSECHLPLFKLLKRLMADGRSTAKELYGCRGFCAHHNTNLWASSDLEGIFEASPFWVMGGAWLSLHLYEHYLYTGNKEFLEAEALPVMREAIRFFEDYLFEDGTGILLTGPTLSPENTYISDKGQKGALCLAPTMDSSILRQLIGWYMQGLEQLGREDREDMAILKNILDRLPPLKVSGDGRILEWYRPYEEAEPGHRHISHMFALHPGCEITRDKELLYEAARKSIDYRLSHGGGHTGWSRAWLACFMSRLHDGNRLYENIIRLLQQCIQDNLLALHPPFQIDGNFGIAEAILEGFAQSHSGYIELLPALPDSFRQGRITGLRLRGAVSADMAWEHGRLTDCTLTADYDRTVEIRYRDIRKTVELKQGIPVQVVI